MELLAEVELELGLEGEEVNVAKVFEGDEAGDAFEELDFVISLEVEYDDEEVVSVLVGRKTPLYVVDDEEEEEDTRHTSVEDEQQGTVVLVVTLVENAPPYPGGKQLDVFPWGLSPGLRNTPSYDTRLHVLVDADEVVPLLEGTLDDGHCVQETTRGWNANTPR